jgi:hypothetical protein
MGSWIQGFREGRLSLSHVFVPSQTLAAAATVSIYECHFSFKELPNIETKYEALQVGVERRVFLAVYSGIRCEYKKADYTRPKCGMGMWPRLPPCLALPDHD